MARSLVYENSLAGDNRPVEHGAPSTDDLSVHAKSAEFVEWQGSRAMRIENGLVILPNIELKAGSVEVEIGVEQAAYPGVAFRVADPMNFELAYSQPHTSGGWDALQYDPIFRGSNTWQIHSGPSYQKDAVIPTGSWYSLRLDFGEDWATLAVDRQPPLVVDGLAHGHRTGMVGLWTFLPAHFRNLRVYAWGDESSPRKHDARVWPVDTPDTPCLPLRAGSVDDRVAPEVPGNVVTEWLLAGYGVIKAEPNGLVLLHRYLPAETSEATLTRQFEVPERTRVEFRYGFTDILSLSVDGVTIFSGSNTYSGVGDRDARGYAEIGAHAMAWDVEEGVHTVKAVVSVREPFGWGIGLSVAGTGLRLRPAWMG